MAKQSSFVEEMMAAGRGVFGLLTGNRQAGGYFDFSRRGLLGSFIALLLVTALNAVLPVLLGVTGGSIARDAAAMVILFVLQIGFSAIVLRQLKRLDGLVPYLVADNWATFFLTLIQCAVAASGLSNDFTLVVLAIVVISVEVNIARLVVTLSPLQIAMFLVAQLVGVVLGLQLLGYVFPMPEAVQIVS